jgi:hypothetical protein
MQHDSNEAFLRILIDKALEFSGWNLLDSHQVRFELNTENGRADYLLGGPRGPVCVLEAKREDVDPYDAKGPSSLPCQFALTLRGKPVSAGFCGSSAYVSKWTAAHADH